MPLDHIPLVVPPSAFDPITKFLLASLGHLGFKELRREMDGLVGLGEDHAYFWISSLSSQGLDESQLLQSLGRQHHAFVAESMCPYFVCV